MQLPTGNSNLFGYEKADLTRQVENIRSKKYMLIHGTLDGEYYVDSWPMIRLIA